MSIIRSYNRNVEPKCVDAPRKVGLDNKRKLQEKARKTQPPITAPPIEEPRSAASCEHWKPELN